MKKEDKMLLLSLFNFTFSKLGAMEKESSEVATFKVCNIKQNADQLKKCIADPITKGI